MNEVLLRIRTKALGLEVLFAEAGFPKGPRDLSRIARFRIG